LSDSLTDSRFVTAVAFAALVPLALACTTTTVNATVATSTVATMPARTRAEPIPNITTSCPSSVNQ
jgi:hypothetical protein